MPAARKYGYKRKPAARRPRRKAVRKSKTAMNRMTEPNKAVVSESRQLVNPDVGAGNFGHNQTHTQAITLSDYTRCMATSALFQEYRIIKAKFTFKPAYETYPANQITAPPANSQIPEFYYLIDKANNMTVSTMSSAQQFRSCGSTPFKFTRNKVVTYTPCVNLLPDNAYAGIIKKSPWISTNWNQQGKSDAINHYGILWRSDAALANSTQNFYIAECEIVVEFRRPIPTVAA